MLVAFGFAAAVFFAFFLAVFFFCGTFRDYLQDFLNAGFRAIRILWQKHVVAHAINTMLAALRCFLSQWFEAHQICATAPRVEAFEGPKDVLQA